MSITETHIDRPHAEFGPSGIKYIAKCAGFKGRDGTSEPAEKGNRIHFALETGDISLLQSEDEVSIYDRCKADIDNELVELRALTGIEPEVHQEVRLLIQLDHTKTFGTADVVAISGDVAVLCDFKTGGSKIDAPPENYQSKAYAVGVFQMFPQVDTIKAVFSIPVRDELLVGFYRRGELAQYTSELSQIICRAERVRPLWYSGEQDLDNLNPSVDCRFCAFEDRCPALGAVAIDIVKRTKPELLPDGPIDLQDIENPETLDTLYLAAKIVESWASGIKQRAMRLANDGVEFPNLRLKSMGSLKKTEDTNRLAELAMHHGLTLHEVISAANLSVTQLSKVIYDKSSRGKKSNAVDSFESEALETGIVSVGPVRYTLTDR